MVFSLLYEDFSDFPIGAFPYDTQHSAMGEYHYYPPEGYQGNFYDPISCYSFTGPSWLITPYEGRHLMEQQRMIPREDKPTVYGTNTALVSGSKKWRDYTVSTVIRPLIKDGPCGLLFRYQTSMMHYGFYLSDNRVLLEKTVKFERTTIDEKPFEYDCDSFYTLKVSVSGSTICCYVNDELVIKASDDTYKEGCAALSSFMPAQYKELKVVCDETEYKRILDQEKADADDLAVQRAKYSKMRLHKVIDLKNFGSGRHIRFGHLLGTDELFFIMAQNQKRVYKDRYAFISCLTAVSMETGEVLWQIGEPSDLIENTQLTADLPMQIYDIDGDGFDEVICGMDFKLVILDGRTGQVKKQIHTPQNVEDAAKLCGMDFKRHSFDRLNIDAIRIVNISGNDRPSDIMIKDRYARLWLFDKDLNFKWMFNDFNTGHFPFGYDFNGDKKDEIFSCYNMVSSDGKLIWKLPINTDHTDEIVVGELIPGEGEVIAIVSGWEGFMIVSKDGKILLRDINGHGQRISIANYIPEMEGLQIACTTYWGNQGIVYLYDGHGNELWHMEQGVNGNIVTPVNWQGDGTELILMNSSEKYGGLYDGQGRLVVEFPDDGHPTLAAEVLDITGDKRDEIVVWDRYKMYIYTQDGKAPDGDMEYAPHKYPHYNASNYRGEYSFANWIKRK